MILNIIKIFLYCIVEDEANDGAQVFCTEDTPAVFSRADSLSSLGSDDDNTVPSALERQKVIEIGKAIPAPGENLQLEKGELETNCYAGKEKQISSEPDLDSTHQRTLTPPLSQNIENTRVSLKSSPFLPPIYIFLLSLVFILVKLILSIQTVSL